MSDLTPCNYCNVQWMWQRAKERRTKLIIKYDPEMGMMSARYANEDKPSAWFVELTEHCAC